MSFPLLYIFVEYKYRHGVSVFWNSIIDVLTTAFSNTGLGRTAYDDICMVSQFPIKIRCTPVRESLEVNDIGTI